MKGSVEIMMEMRKKEQPKGTSHFKDQQLAAIEAFSAYMGLPMRPLSR